MVCYSFEGRSATSLLSVTVSLSLSFRPFYFIFLSLGVMHFPGLLEGGGRGRGGDTDSK